MKKKIPAQEHTYTGPTKYFTSHNRTVKPIHTTSLVFKKVKITFTVE